MQRPALLLYALVTYALFNATFLYFVGFLLDLGVPKGINDGVLASTATAVATNASLVFIFGFFHSLMAREKFKGWWIRLVSPEAERSTYVLQASVFLALLMWMWRPMPMTLWQLENSLMLAVYGFFSFGVIVVLLSTFLINHFELFGLQQVWIAQSNRPIPQPKFVTPFLYRIVRHPMQLGILLVLFATPHMTVGHFFLASTLTIYVMIGLHFEERSLVRVFGHRYKLYQQQVPMLLPIPGRCWRSDSAIEPSR